MIGSIFKIFGTGLGLILESKVAAWIRYFFNMYNRYDDQKKNKQFHEERCEALDQSEQERNIEDAYFDSSQPPGASKNPADKVQ